MDERNIIGKIGYHSFANLALLNYRYGHFEEAERLYRECISMTENSESKALATTTMAKEALLANAPNSSQLIEEARKIVLNTKSAGAIKMLERLGQTDVQKTKKKTENQDIKWLHDKATNTLLITKNQPFKVKD